MKSKTITVHTIVKNEDQWLWYSLKPLLNHVDKLFVFDTGSTDNTVKIIKSIKSKKIIFEQKGDVDRTGMTKLRQEQLDNTKTDWFLILDGDEIWPEKTIKEVIELINKAPDYIYGIVIRAWNLIGDIKHYHPESLDYSWPFAAKEYKGWMNLRAINRKIPGLHLKGEYPLEAYCDIKNIPIQNYGRKKLLFTKNRYFHMTYLPRSSKKNIKPDLRRGPYKKPEIGMPLPENVLYPEVFYLNRPNFVPSCWIEQTLEYRIKALFFTPFKYFKRKILKY